jgi:phospholipid/cholesterol/gamma-HCH transport system permease protein
VKAVRALDRAVSGLVEETGRWVTMLWKALYWTFRGPWDLREWFRQMARVGVDSVPVVFLAAFFTGAVIALQTYEGFQRFHAEGYVGSVVSLSMLRELAPVLSALMVTGRVGSAYAAEIGTMRVTEQIDALYALAANPIQYLVVPRLWASVIMMPLLVVMADATGILGGYLVAVGLLKANAVVYEQSTFQFLDLNDFFSGVVKAAVFGLILAVTGCMKGFHTEGGAEGVGKATTRSVVMASLIILLSDFFLTKVLFR